MNPTIKRDHLGLLISTGIALISGFFIKELTNWVSPFTNSVTIEYVYIFGAFIVAYVVSNITSLGVLIGVGYLFISVLA